MSPLFQGGFFIAMKIFISLKTPRGDAELEQLALLTNRVIQLAGHEPFVATWEITNAEFSDAKGFMPFVRQHVRTSELMIVLNHLELRGGLIELGMAYALGIPIWLCHIQGEKVSSSALGCADLTIEYTSLEDLRIQLTAYLSELSAA